MYGLMGNAAHSAQYTVHSEVYKCGSVHRSYMGGNPKGGH
jgi:hypothetical protein